MHRFLCVCLVAAAVLPSASGSVERRVAVREGLSIVLPQGWNLARRSITTCSSPAQRLVATTAPPSALRAGHRIPPRSALVLLMEGASGRFPGRPASFALPRALSNIGGCCEIPTGPGVELLFRDHGRRFYAFVYLGHGAAPETRLSILELLDSLRVSGRP